ncbi:carbohydrate ABC transporter substrate-binding protein [Paenibacillaceae bacterium]|nr:carbohydrate ABC transporter substrate-binding protein [Paenibacillaceae bacterium]
MKKVISMLMAVSLAASIIAGCGAKDASTDTGGKQTDAPKVTLHLIQSKVEVANQVKQMAADYNKEHPNVTIEAQLSSDTETLLKTRFASGDEPDIFYVKGFKAMRDWQDKLLDLSGEPWMSDVLPFAEPGMTIGDEKYGFPAANEGYGFIYNKDLFAKAGIDNVPVTLSELREVNEKLKAAGITSYSEGYKETWVARHFLALPFAYMPDPQGNAGKIDAGEALIKDMPTMNGFFEVLDMTTKYGKGTESVGISYDNQVANFATGKSAMLQQGVWAIDPIQKINPDINMGMFAIPFTDNAEDTKLPVGIPGYYVVNKNSKNVEEAKKFLTWLHANGQKYLVESMFLIPAFKSMKATDELGPLAKDMQVYVDNGKTIPFGHLLWPTGMEKQFAKPFQAYVGEQISKDQAIEEMQKMWNSAKK